MGESDWANLDEFTIRRYNEAGETLRRFLLNNEHRIANGEFGELQDIFIMFNKRKPMKAN